ncbi:MAG: hypothetical protein Q9170_003322 [Blastenia crenularia]
MYLAVSVEGLDVGTRPIQSWQDLPAYCCETAQALLWTFTAIAIVLSIGRFIIRYATAGKFYLDDASHLLSVVLLAGLAAAYTTGFPYSARIARIGLKKEKPPPLTDPFYHKYLQLRLTVTLLVFMVLWSVKATFLIFYRLLFDVSKTFVRLWWAAVALTFATFWVCIGSTFTLCGSVDDLYDFIITLPLYMIYGLQLRNSQKAVLGGLLSLGFVVAIFDIIRTYESLRSGTFSGVALWSSLEVTIAVIVASLPLYRVLLSAKGRNSLMSRLSIDRYKDLETSNTSNTERGFLDTRTSPGKPSVSTFRDGLETRDVEFPKKSRGAQHVPLAYISR